MPRAIDTEALESPNMKVLDINNPPTKNIPHQAYPKMVYLHPKDKTKEHKYKVVHTSEEHETAEKQGYKTKPHIPAEPVEDLSQDFEAAGPDIDPLDSMTKVQLIAAAAERGVEVDPTAKKDIILAAIREASGAE